jgi:hypothetical protein
MDTAVASNPAHAGEGIIILGGRQFMTNGKGGFDPIDAVKPQNKLEDQTVRGCMKFAIDLSDQIARFRDHSFADLAEFDALLAEKYGAKVGGAKGNRTYTTYDGLMKIEVKVQDQFTFGPELQIAKQLIDECLVEWSADSRPEIQSIVTKAFNTEKEGQVNRADIFMLLKLEIQDERWQRAMDAIRDAIKITGSKEYLRFYTRRDQKDGWTAITIDLAKA